MEMSVFQQSETGTLGMELEVQLLCKQTLDLKPCAPALLAALHADGHSQFKQEVTCSMLEINSTIHHNAGTLLQEMYDCGQQLRDYCHPLDALPCGGGTHPFQDWRQRRISDHPRYHDFASQYGYLARQFTVFGQHVHIGCPDGDTAVWLCHALAYYIPHLLALSAASPFVQGEYSGFASARSNTVHAFPNSGHMPSQLRRWQDFQQHAEMLASHGIINSLKDLYWDIRPKPEYGTVEIRIFDTPHSLRHAVRLAALSQALARYFIQQRPSLPGREALYSVYGYNRFQAARHGLAAEFIDVCSGQRRSLREHLLATLPMLRDFASCQQSQVLLDELANNIKTGQPPHHTTQANLTAESLPLLLREQVAHWLD